MTTRTPPLPDTATADQVAALVERIRDSGAMGTSERRLALLRYLLEAEAEGRGDTLKAYTIAMDVLGRGPDFDPATDSIVRVEVGRLRDALALFYATADTDGLPHVEIPKGTYRPTIDWTPAATRSAGLPAPTTSAGRTPPTGRPQAARLAARVAQFVIVAAISAILGGLAFDALRPERSAAARFASDTLAFAGPRLGVAPFHYLGIAPEDAYLSDGLTTDTVRALSGFSWLSVFPIPRGTATDPGFAETRPEAGAVDYVLFGAVQKAGDQLKLTVAIQDQASGRLVWSEDASETLSAGDPMTIQKELAERVAVEIARPEGIVFRLEERRLAQAPDPAFEAYDCVLRVYHYWRSYDPGLHARSRDCLEAALPRHPTYADGHAALAFLYLDEVRYGINARDGSEARAHAASAVEEALRLDPLSTLALEAGYTLAAQIGDFAGFDRGALAGLRLAPNDPDLLSDVANKLALNFGRWDESRPLIARASALNPDPPQSYIFAEVHRAYRDGDCDLAARLSGPEARERHVLIIAAMLACAGANADAEAAEVWSAALGAAGHGSAEEVQALFQNAALDPEHAGRLARDIEAALALVSA